MDDAEFAAATEEARLVGGWLPTQELLSLIFERLDALYIAFVQANSKKPPRLSPATLPRPAELVERARTRVISAADAGRRGWEGLWQ